MTKNVALLISMGILFMASGCSKTQVSADSAPAAEAATVAPAPPALPPQLGQSPAAATKQSVDSHKGEQFYGWGCKIFDPLQSDRKASVELMGLIVGSPCLLLFGCMIRKKWLGGMHFIGRDMMVDRKRAS